MTLAACVGSLPTASILVSPHRIAASSRPNASKSRRAKPPLLPPRLVHPPHHAHATRPIDRAAAAFHHPHAGARGKIPIAPAAPPPPTSRDFVPWRFSAAGRSSAGIGHLPGGRKPAQRETIPPCLDGNEAEVSVAASAEPMCARQSHIGRETNRSYIWSPTISSNAPRRVQCFLVSLCSSSHV